MSTQTAPSSTLTQRGESQTTIQPLGVAGSLVLFGVPAAITFIAFHILRPWLESLGLDERVHAKVVRESEPGVG
jgi:hypothetical protein